jgi:FkbM family methyltransferase
VRLEHAAVSSKNGRTLLATSTRGGKPLGGSSRILKDPGNAGRVTTEEISLVTVDELLPEERLVGALHLDVEGHLREALEGAMVMVERCRPLLVLEGSPDADWIDSLLRPLGYAMEGWVHANMVLRAADPRQSVQ